MAYQRPGKFNLEGVKILTAHELALKAMDELPKDPHIIRAAERLLPAWIAANGNRNVPTVTEMASEIAVCVSAIIYNEGTEPDKKGFALGHGIMAMRGPIIDGVTIGVVSAEVFWMRMNGPYGLTPKEGS